MPSQFEIKKTLTLGELAMITGLLGTALLWFFKTGGQLQSIIDRQAGTDRQLLVIQDEERDLASQTKAQSDQINQMLRIIDWNRLKGPH